MYAIAPVLIQRTIYNESVVYMNSSVLICRRTSLFDDCPDNRSICCLGCVDKATCVVSCKSENCEYVGIALSDDVRTQFSRVFDENGHVKSCGRDACISLIESCRRIYPGKLFGDVKTGMMNTDELMDLWRKSITVK